MKNVFVSKENDNQRAAYEAPAVVYEGLISTRAGSGVLGGASSNSAAEVNTDELFDN